MLDAHGSVIKFAVDISRKVVAGGSEFTSNARKLCWKMAASKQTFGAQTGFREREKSYATRS